MSGRDVQQVDALAGATAKLVDGISGLTEHWADGELRQVEWSGVGRVLPGLTLPVPGVEAGGALGTWDRSDEAIRRAVKHRRRQMKDSGWDAKDRTVRRLAVENYQDHREQLVRFVLRMRYGARDPWGPEGDRGTDVYDHYMRLDQPASYALAAAIDRVRWQAGQHHALRWDASTSKLPAARLPLP